MEKMPENPIREMYTNPPDLVTRVNWGVKELARGTLPAEMPQVEEGHLLALNADIDGYNTRATAILCGPNPNEYYQGTRHSVEKFQVFDPVLLSVDRKYLDACLRLNPDAVHY